MCKASSLPLDYGDVTVDSFPAGAGQGRAGQSRRGIGWCGREYWGTLGSIRRDDGSSVAAQHIDHRALPCSILDPLIRCYEHRQRKSSRHVAMFVTLSISGVYSLENRGTYENYEDQHHQHVILTKYTGKSVREKLTVAQHSACVCVCVCVCVKMVPRIFAELRWRK
jgi:hypothetical protein